MTKRTKIYSTLLAMCVALSFHGIALADDLNTGQTDASVGYEEPAQIDRVAMIEELVVQWTTDDMGAYELRVTLENSNDSKLLAAWEADSFDEIRSILKGGSELDGPSALGDPDEDYTYTPVTPCRIVDTRNAGGMLAAGTTREFFVHGSVSSQGGAAAGCVSPIGEPRGVMVNVTAVPSGNGNLRAYPSDVSTPNASLVNYKTGVPNANAGAVKTAYLAGADLEIFSSANSHVIIDVLGYYQMPEATQPQYIRVSSGSVSVAANSYETVLSPYCPTGYQWVSASTQGITQATYLMGIGQTGTEQRSFCIFRNLEIIAKNVTCYASCIRVPGR